MTSFARFALAFTMSVVVLLCAQLGATNHVRTIANVTADETVVLDFTGAGDEAWPMAQALQAAGFTGHQGDQCECLYGPRSVAEAMAQVRLSEDMYPGGASVTFLDGYVSVCASGQDVSGDCTPEDAAALRGVALPTLSI